MKSVFDKRFLENNIAFILTHNGKLGEHPESKLVSETKNQIVNWLTENFEIIKKRPTNSDKKIKSQGRDSMSIQKKCYNCKHASKQFKAGGMSHIHCQNEELYPSKDFETGKLSAWDTLREWWSKCKSWEGRA